MKDFKQGKFQAEVIEVTPEIARQMLARNSANRPLRRSYVSTLAHAIRRGDWMLNGESIKFSQTGALLDGQHRLSAVIEAQKSVKVVVVYGLANDAFITIDMNRRRTAADALAIAGVPNEKLMAAAIRLILILSNNPVQFRQTFTPSEVKEWCDAYQDELHQWLTLARMVSKTNLLDPSIVIGLSYYFHAKDPEAVRPFFARIADGMGLEHDDPIFALRELLAKNATSVSKLPRHFIVATVIKAWNMRRSSDRVKNFDDFLRFDSNHFPEIK